MIAVAMDLTDLCNQTARAIELLNTMKDLDTTRVEVFLQMLTDALKGTRRIDNNVLHAQLLLLGATLKQLAKASAEGSADESEEARTSENDTSADADWIVLQIQQRRAVLHDDVFEGKDGRCLFDRCVIMFVQDSAAWAKLLQVLQPNEIEEIQSAADARDPLEQMHREYEAAAEFGWPPTLCKSMVDSYNYLIKIRGEEKPWEFESSSMVSAEIVRLHGVEWDNNHYGFHPREVDVAVEDIVWITDAQS